MSDFSDTNQLTRKLSACTAKLHELALSVGKARQIKEFSSDMRKQALALEMIKALKRGESAAAAECEARASDTYAQSLQRLSDDYAEAEKTIAEWTATQASFDAARSLLSFSKESLRQLEG